MMTEICIVITEICTVIYEIELIVSLITLLSANQICESMQLVNSQQTKYQ